MKYIRGLLNTHLRALLAPLAVLALLPAPAAAHEFWIWPQTFTPAAGAKVALTLQVGEQFEGELIGFSAAHATALRAVSRGGSQDLFAQLPPGAVLPAFDFVARKPGAQVIAFDSQPLTVTLGAEKFFAYLRDEGLDEVIRQRAENGKADTPGRERFRRNVKTLLQAGGKTDDSALLSTGQRMEIVPLANPAKDGPSLAFAIRFDGKPLQNALLKAWHQHAGQLVLLRARTDAQGRVELHLPYRGAWMLSAVHMLPAAAGDTEVEWESWWANLTFLMPK